QISRNLARRRSLAGADRRHPRGCSIPLLDADTARHWIVARNRICLGCPAVASAASDRQNAVTLWPACGSAPCILIFHRAWALDSRRNPVCELDGLLHGRDKPPRWRIPPDLVCNIVDGAIYRSERRRTAAESPIRPRFVPDSFHTLSTGLSSPAVVIDKHHLSCVILPQPGFNVDFVLA